MITEEYWWDNLRGDHILLGHVGWRMPLTWSNNVDMSNQKMQKVSAKFKLKDVEKGKKMIHYQDDWRECIARLEKCFLEIMKDSKVHWNQRMKLYK